MRMPILVALFLAGAAVLAAAKNLEVYSIDVEGGQSTLIVAPSGESLLVDTGWPGFNHRDADRILAAAKAAGVKRIDYLLTTHFHVDHVGGVPQLAEKIPIVNFVDHGTSTETGKNAEVLFNAYSAFRDKGHHIQVKPGDTIPIKGLDVRVISSGGEVLSTALPGAGQPNPDCAGLAQPAADQTENGRSVGFLLTFGDFRMVDLADLTVDREYPLVCPVNRLGTADLWVVSHHGLAQSDSLPFVHALHPRVALMNNGARKGGDPAVWDRIHDTPGLLDLWQLHFAVAGGKEHNSADPFIANVDEICEGKWLKVTVLKDGSFTVYNSRNRYEKSYPKR
jgi:competence protein ComEC